MAFKISSILLLPLASSSVHALSINTPASVVECQPLQLSWSNGSAPYYLAVIPGGDTTTALENLPTQESASSYTWTCDLASGTSVGFRVTDSTGLIAYTDSVTVQAGSDPSCVGSSSSSSSSSTNSNSTTSVSSVSSEAVSASAAALSSSTSTRLSTTTRSSSASTSTASTPAAGSNDAASTSSTSGAFATFQHSSVVLVTAGLGLFSLLAL